MKYLILALVVPLNSFAVFQYLYQGYKKSSRFESLIVQKEIYDADYEFNLNKYDWNLEFGANYSDSFLQALFSFQTNQTISQGLSVGLKKQTFEFGEFSFTHSRTQLDLSRWTNTGLNSFDSNVYEVRNSLAYSFDLINRPLLVEFEEIETKKGSDALEMEIKKNKDALDFFQSYIETKHKVVLNRYYEDFKVRAQKRVSLVRRRVQDGLSRKVELQQSQISLMGRDEEIIKNKAVLEENVYLIEHIIGQKVPEKMYMGIKWPFRAANNFQYIFDNKKPLEIERLEILNKLNELKVKRQKLLTQQRLKFKLSYTKNAFNEDENEAFSDAFGDGNNDEKVASLTYSIPFGQGRSSVAETKHMLEQKRSRLELRNLEDDYKAQELSFINTLKKYEKTISIAQKKVGLSMKSIKETQTLYLRGQSSFEDLLRAEESFINSKINLVNLISFYELTMAKLAYLNGQLSRFLDEYRD